MRVLYVIDTLGLGGAERQLLQTTAYLASCGIEQAVLQLFPGDDLAAEFRRNGVEVRSLGLRPNLPALPAALRPALAAARAISPTVISTHLPSSDIIGRSVAKMLAVPSISTWHSTLYDLKRLPDRRVRIRAATRIYRALDRFTAPFGSRFVAISSTVLSSYRDALGVSGSICSIIPNSLDMRRFRAMGKRSPRRRSLRLIHVGRHVPDKGLDILLEAVALLPEPLNVTLDLFGKGTLSDGLARKAAAQGLSSKVRFHGAVNDVVPFLSNADLFVLPSLREGQCLAYLEALASGLPVIASDIPALREVDPSGSATLFFRAGDPQSLADALVTAIESPSLMTAWAKHAPSLVEPFDIDTVGPMHWELIRSTGSSA